MSLHKYTVVSDHMAALLSTKSTWQRLIWCFDLLTQARGFGRQALVIVSLGRGFVGGRGEVYRASTWGLITSLAHSGVFMLSSGAGSLPDEMIYHSHFAAGPKLDGLPWLH